jgi:hypothetical protein
MLHRISVSRPTIRNLAFFNFDQSFVAGDDVLGLNSHEVVKETLPEQLQ